MSGDGPTNLIADAPASMRVATTLCGPMTVSHAPGMGLVYVKYDRELARCGRCLLCVLLYQVPANDRADDPEPT